MISKKSLVPLHVVAETVLVNQEMVSDWTCSFCQRTIAVGERFRLYEKLSRTWQEFENHKHELCLCNECIDAVYKALHEDMDRNRKGGS